MSLLSRLLVVVGVTGHQVRDQAVDGIRDSVALVVVGHGCIVSKLNGRGLDATSLAAAMFIASSCLLKFRVRNEGDQRRAQTRRDGGTKEPQAPNLCSRALAELWGAGTLRSSRVWCKSKYPAISKLAHRRYGAPYAHCLSSLEAP